MIVRKEPNGELFLVGQTEHSRLVGAFSAHWGNDRFARPEPYESLARVAAYHDYGWLRYETRPYYDKESGETPGFRNVPFNPAQLEAYEWCFDWLLKADPYASLIANMHRTGLSRARYGAIDHPKQSAPPKLRPEVETFVQRNEARQEGEKKAFDADRVRTNYTLMQVWDLLGLYFACQDPYEDHIEPVPLGYGNGASNTVRLKLNPVGPRKVAFDPYPFDVRPLSVPLIFKRMPQVTYSDDKSFLEAYFRAPTEVMQFELV